MFVGACQNMPEPYMPPEQRAPLEEFRPYTATRVVQMADPDAWTLFVQDIGGLEGNWRWTGKRPTVRLRPRAKEGLHYVLDFTLPDVTFKETGPVTMSFYVDDHLLGSERYPTAGAKHVDKPVPAEWITPAQDVLISAEIDKVWVSKDDGAKLGFILTSIGLAQP
jgi:hypothetical protein